MSTWARRVLVGVAIVLAIGVVSLDIATGLWAQMPIISGIVSSLVMLLLTLVFVDRIVAHHAYRRWQPVTRIALTDILHAVTTDGPDGPQPRLIGPLLHRPAAADDDDEPGVQFARTLRLARKERRVLGGALGTWSAFLASNAPVRDVVDHAAFLADKLDDVRAAVFAARAAPTQGADADAARERAYAKVERAVDEYDVAAHALIKELRETIAGLPDPLVSDVET